MRGASWPSDVTWHEWDFPLIESASKDPLASSLASRRTSPIVGLWPNELSHNGSSKFQFSGIDSSERWKSERRFES